MAQTTFMLIGAAVAVGAAMTVAASRVQRGLRRALIERQKRRLAASTCAFCGHPRIRRYCARCGRSSGLKPLEVPAALGKATISPSVAPGLRAVLKREEGAC